MKKTELTVALILLLLFWVLVISPVQAERWSTPTTIAAPLTVGFTADLSISADGSKIAFSASADENSEIFVVNWDGAGLKQLTNDPSYNHGTPAISGDGSKIAFCVGMYGEVFVSVDLDMDLTAPVTVDDYDGSWQAVDFSINLTATDELSGVAETYYKINDGATRNVTAHSQPLITTEGANNTLEYWSTDIAGNEESHKVLTEIELDKTAPTGSITINNDDNSTSSTSVMLTLSTNDTSGVAQMRFSHNGTDWTSWETYVTSKDWALPSDDGTKTVYVQFKDNVGWISDVHSDTIILDTRKSAPAFPMEFLLAGIGGIAAVAAVLTYLKKRRSSGRAHLFSKLFMCLLMVTIGVQFVNLAAANFLPPPPELPYGYIRGDGTVEPQTLPIRRVGDTYTFTGNITDYTIEVQRANIVIDGAGYTLQGNGTGKGIVLTNTTNVTIKNMALRKLRIGIHISQSSSNTISETAIISTEIGIWLYSSSNNDIERNKIKGNFHGIVFIEYSNYNNMAENLITENQHGGIMLEFGNKHTSNYNNIIRNTITANSVFGMRISSSSNCRIEGNYIANSEWGIQLHGSACQHNKLVGNRITNTSKYGIQIAGGFNHNTITENTITNSEIGIDIFVSNNNEFYHNNFINNKKQVSNNYVDEEYPPISIAPSVNSWDDGYPSGGNYWSDYNGTDNNGDDTGDTPYIIDANNKDRYPLMKPFVNQEPQRGTPPSTNSSGQQPGFLGSSLPIEYSYVTIGIAVIAVAGTAGHLYLRRKNQWVGE